MSCSRRSPWSRPRRRPGGRTVGAPPRDVCPALATLAMFGDDDPLGHPILGEPSVIAAADIANVAEFHRAAHGDPSIVLAPAGNVDHDHLCELAASLLGAPTPVELPHRPSA